MIAVHGGQGKSAHFTHLAEHFAEILVAWGARKVCFWRRNPDCGLC